MPKPKDQWGEKFMREQPFMAFGSLMNAYAQMHQQKPVDINEFMGEAKALFTLAQQLTEKSFTDAEPEEPSDMELS